MLMVSVSSRTTLVENVRGMTKLDGEVHVSSILLNASKMMFFMEGMINSYSDSLAQFWTLIFRCT